MGQRQTCPHCAAVLSLPDHLVGKEVMCPKCKKPFQSDSLTAGAVVEERAQPQPPKDASDKPVLSNEAKRSESAWKKYLWLWLIVAGVVLAPIANPGRRHTEGGRSGHGNPIPGLLIIAGAVVGVRRLIQDRHARKGQSAVSVPTPEKPKAASVATVLDPMEEVPCPKCKGTGRLRCPDCRGTGRKKCPQCNGKGTRTLHDYAAGKLGDATGGGVKFRTEQCITCRGTGQLDEACPRCHGNRRVACGFCHGKGKVTRQQASKAGCATGLVVAIGAVGILWMLVTRLA